MSSKRAIRRRQCTGKNRYTKTGAQKAARWRSAVSKSLILSYHCTFCGGWHLGHPPKRIRQAMEQHP